jgi:hypothetical protein
MQVFYSLSGLWLFLNRKIKSIGMKGSQQNPNSLCCGLKEFCPLLRIESNETGDMIFGDNKGVAGQYRSYIIHSKKITGFQENTFLYLWTAKGTGHWRI